MALSITTLRIAERLVQNFPTGMCMVEIQKLFRIRNELFSVIVALVSLP